MPADPRVYDSERLAGCYANDRPPVHATICARVIGALPAACRVRAALDIGCGAGDSTAALLAYAEAVTGVDPFARMLRRARARLPTATFVEGVAAALPVASDAFDLVTAAGSLNYADDLHAALAEVARVLTRHGHFAAYDFATGRIATEDPRTASCFATFERRFPWPPGYALDLAALPLRAHGLVPVLHEKFVVELSMSAEEYLRYLMSETNVEAAVAAGASEAEARDACRSAFGPLLTNRLSTVYFKAVVTLARKA